MIYRTYWCWLNLHLARHEVSARGWELRTGLLLRGCIINATLWSIYVWWSELTGSSHHVLHRLIHLIWAWTGSAMISVTTPSAVESLASLRLLHDLLTRVQILHLSVTPHLLWSKSPVGSLWWQDRSEGTWPWCLSSTLWQIWQTAGIPSWRVPARVYRLLPALIRNLPAHRRLFESDNFINWNGSLWVLLHIPKHLLSVLFSSVPFSDIERCFSFLETLELFEIFNQQFFVFQTLSLTL